MLNESLDPGARALLEKNVDGPVGSSFSQASFMEIMEKNVEILVADDEPAVAVAIKSALKFCGYNVVTVPSGEAALERVQAEPARFSLVLSDHNMPGGGGMALVKGLRASGYTGRVVILSAFLGRDVEAQYEALGVDGMLTKPFNIDRLRSALDGALNPAGSR